MAFLPCLTIAQELPDAFTQNDLAFASTADHSPFPLGMNESDAMLAGPIEDNRTKDWFAKNKKLFNDTDLNLQDGMVSFTKDKKTVFFSVNKKIKQKKRKGEEDVKTKNSVQLRLFRAKVKENGEWVDLEMLPFNSNNFSTGQPYLNHDDSKLYFVSDGPASLGRTDIFSVDLNADGTYGLPMNLGPKINSSEREIFPLIDAENVLYFSSDAGSDDGELNIFASKIFDNTVAAPIKLNGSVNDETGSYMEAYRMTDPVDFECQQQITGIVKNADTQELLPNVQIILFDENDNKLNSFLSDETDASFNFMQSCNAAFTLKGYLEGYKIGELDIKTLNDLNARPEKIVIQMHVDDNQMHMKPVADATEDKEATLVEVSEISEENITTQIDSDSDFDMTTYDFSSDKRVYTVQIGAFKGDAETEKYGGVTNLFDFHYNDGLKRYYSGVFETYAEAANYLRQLRELGYNDAFVVGLQGKERM